MTFFKYNNTNEKSCCYLYKEISKHYVYLQKKWQWKPRQKRFIIERMYHCNLFVKEKYYLRLLFTIVQGPKSFQDLYTVDGISYPIF